VTNQCTVVCFCFCFSLFFEKRERRQKKKGSLPMPVSGGCSLLAHTVFACSIANTLCKVNCSGLYVTNQVYYGCCLAVAVSIPSSSPSMHVYLFTTTLGDVLKLDIRDSMCRGRRLHRHNVSKTGNVTVCCDSCCIYCTMFVSTIIRAYVELCQRCARPITWYLGMQVSS
jgi:hypothetical protein